MSAVFSVEVWKYVVAFCCVGLRGGGGVVCGKQNTTIIEKVLAAGAYLEAKNKLRGQGRVEVEGAQGAILSFSCYLRYWLCFDSAVGCEVMCDLFVKDVSREGHTPVRTRTPSPEPETQLLVSRRFGWKSCFLYTLWLCTVGPL